MKTKSIIVKPGLLTKRDVANGGECVNMRCDASGTLVPVGRLAEVADGDYVPICYCAKGEERVLLAHRGLYLYAIADDGVVESVAELEAVVLCGVAVADGAVLMLADRACRVEWDNGNWIVEYDNKEHPVVRLKVVSTAQFSAATSPRLLSGYYSHWQGGLNDDDCKAVASDVKTIYARVCDDARRAGCYVQPVVARYRLYDNRGCMVVESAPVVLSVDGLQGLDGIVAQVDANEGAYNQLKSYTLTVNAFMVGYEVDERWADVLADYTIRIYVTPQLHPVDWEAKAMLRQEGSTTQSANLHIYLPGASSATDRCRESVGLLMSRFDSLAQEVAAGQPEVGTTVIRRIAGEGMAADVKAWQGLTVAERDNDEASVLMSDCRLPHRWVASTGRVVGDIVVWGDIHTMKSEGYAVPMFAVEVDGKSGRWYAWAKVTMADGESVLWKGEGDGNAPLKLSPLLSYPHRNAVKMKVMVCYADQSVKSREVKLTPEGDMAVWIDESLAPIELLDDEAYIVPSVCSYPTRYDGAVAIAKSGQPLSMAVGHIVSQGRVVAVTPAVKSISSWDFARCHLYAFTRDGICAVSVDGRRKNVASNIIDGRCVERADGVAVSPSQVYAVASGSLVAVSGSRVKTLKPCVEYCSVGWNRAMGELWCVGKNGDVTIIADGGEYHRSENVDRLTAMADGQLLLGVGDRLVSASRENAEERVVMWCKRIDVGQKWRPARVVSCVDASWGNIVVTVKGDRGGNTPLTMLSMAVDGEINAPITARVYAPARRYLTLTIEGTLSADAQVGDVELLMVE